jgi:hypothetical protein
MITNGSTLMPTIALTLIVFPANKNVRDKTNNGGSKALILI